MVRTGRTSHIPHKGQVMVRYYGLYALIRKPHRGLRSAEMIRKVYEVGSRFEGRVARR